MDTDYAYMAGIIDGEGSIMLTKLNPNRFRSAVLAVATTDRELLEWIVARYGGSIINKKTYQDHHKPSYSWRIASRQVIELLEKVYPYLQIERKRLRAKMLIDEYVSLTPRNGKYTDAMRIAREEFEDRFAST